MIINQARSAIIERPSHSIRFFPDQWDALSKVVNDPKIKNKYGYAGNVITAAVMSFYENHPKKE